MAQPSQQPALDDTNRGLHFRLVARPPRPCRKNGAPIVRRHGAIGPVDLGIEVARLDDRHLGIVGHKKRRRTAEELQRLNMAFDPVRKRLGPARLRERKAGRSQDRHEQVCLPRLARQPVDDDRHRVAGIIDEQLVAARMLLPHRHRQLHRPAAVKVTIPAVAIAIRITADILVPENLQRHVLALELAMHLSPVRLGARR